jgi:sugar (pentulose or hexulose) kinase
MKAGKFSALVLSAALLASPTLAAEIAPAPLPPGHAAGTKQADLFGVTGLPLVIIVAAVGLALAAGLGAFDNTKTVSSTGTSG